MSIIFDSNTKTFFLNGKGITYAMCICDNGYLSHLYFGSSVGCDDLRYTHAVGRRSTLATPPGVDKDSLSYGSFSPELAFFGTGDYREPAVMVRNPAGDRLCQLLYCSHEILDSKPAIDGMPSLDGGQTLVISLKDALSGFGAELYYTVYDDASVITRHAVFTNSSDNALTLDRAYSFSLALPTRKYDVLTLEGSWASERSPQRTHMHNGVISIDSKRCSSSAVLNPFMAVLSRNATETHGKVYGINLVYSSSFVLKAEGTENGDSLITGGINDFDFNWMLGAGERFETPEVVIAFSDEGIGGMSRAFHDAYRNHLIPKNRAFESRPVVINNWEATYFNFDTDKLKAIVNAVEGTGINTFVLDDGWFGKRDNDHSGLGDWYVNTDKLRGGLSEIIAHTHAKGLKFGLWFEPEMVNEDSELFREHPDYAIGAPDRPRCYSRHQYMLDLTRKDVRDHIVRSVNKVLAENEIDYVKWDYNRNVTDKYSLCLPPDRQKEFDHRYALGLYDLCERIVNANPHVFFEGCSGGGARFDPAILYYFPQIWTSDDTDAEERTRIQYGTSICYPLSAMSAHVSAVPNHQTGRTTPFRTRGHVAGMSATGYELDTTRLTDEEKKLISAQTAQYKKHEQLILRGDLYRIDDPFEDNFFSEAVVSKDRSKAIVLVYRTLNVPNAYAKRLTLAGLDPNKTYHIEELDITAKGSTLMNVGIVIKFQREDFTSETYYVHEV